MQKKQETLFFAGTLKAQKNFNNGVKNLVKRTTAITIKSHLNKETLLKDSENIGFL